MLVCANGAYGDRLAEICRQAGVPVTVYAEPYDTPVDAQRIAAHLAADPSITHVAMVHNETTSGLVNDIEAAGAVAKRAGAAFIVDAMSSFGGIDIPVEDWGIDFIVSSANKCIQGVPGFSFAICRRDLLEGSRGKARSLSLDLYAQWQTMERDGGKWRFTSPTNAVLAFATFREMYDYVKARGYVIYPGKLTDGDTFRIGTIGEIYPADILNVTSILGEFVATKRKEA